MRFGISGRHPVDAAKQSAAIVLLDKSLAVIADGVRLGRQTFCPTAGWPDRWG